MGDEERSGDDMNQIIWPNAVFRPEVLFERGLGQPIDFLNDRPTLGVDCQNGADRISLSSLEQSLTYPIGIQVLAKTIMSQRHPRRVPRRGIYRVVGSFFRRFVACTSTRLFLFRSGLFRNPNVGCAQLAALDCILDAPASR
jgi:hypothetical protein